MADDRNAISRMERAKKREDVHNALTSYSIPDAGRSATYDPYSSAALNTKLKLLASANGNRRPVISPTQINASRGVTTQSV